MSPHRAALKSRLLATETTKVPILLASGFWKMAHESRTDMSMWLGSLFLSWVGAGPRSLDARWWGRHGAPRV